MDELLGEFLIESMENISALDDDIITLETHPDNPTLLGKIFRTMHTIKGTCGFLSLPKLEALAHAGENILCKLRENKLSVTPEVVTLILICVDRIKEILKFIEKNQREPDEDNTNLIKKLDNFYHSNFEDLNCSIDLNSQDNDNLGQEDFVEKALEESRSYLEDEGSISRKTICLNVSMLENLMTMVSELVLTRNQLMQMTRDNENPLLMQSMQRLNIVTSELQDGIMKTRMQPIENAWNKLPRLVRDLSNELGKKIELELIGSDTELDRQVLEMIKDPLTHMIRNAADHGIESPADRLLKGKSETGKITLHAYHEGGHIVVNIKDDGKGLNFERIKKRLIEKNLVGADEIDHLSTSQISQYIFLPGFSTASEVTNISGRGVGMDVVHSNIEKIGGSIELKSIEGKGTNIYIKIPLTLAIISGLIVDVKGESFAIPQISIIELVQISPRSPARIKTIHGASFMALRDQLLPLVYLDEILKLTEPRNFNEYCDFAQRYVVVTQVGTQVFGIVVDQVYETQEIVVKPVASILKNIPFYSGNTILGNGRVIMILDPNSIVSQVVQMSSHETIPEKISEMEDSTELDKISFLIFKAGNEILKAVPLGLISRLEEFNTSDIESIESGYVIQYRNHLMPLIAMNEAHYGLRSSKQTVIVFSERDQFIGFLIDEIVDIVHTSIDIKMKSNLPGILGNVIIANHTTEILNVDYFIRKTCPNWFLEDDYDLDEAHDHPKNILLIDDSIFFRNLMMPLLNVEGYHVKAVGSAEEALDLYQHNKIYDAIICDIELPKMNGFIFVSEVRTLELWKDTPLIGISTHFNAQNQKKSQEYGFDACFSKTDRTGMMTMLKEFLSKIKKRAA
ncbi:MAG: chemotaxis protein CheW [Janthinobacterium lividum]